MLKKLRNEFATVFFILATTAVCLFLLLKNNNKVNQYVYSETIPDLSLPSPTLTPAPVAQIETTVMDSPDGTKTLLMKKKRAVGIFTYSIFVSDKPGGLEKSIYKKTENTTHKIIFPYNAWSPDNIHFFLRDSTPDRDGYYVFPASGQPFAGNTPFIDIQKLFLEKVTRYTLADVTGWAAPNLLIVNTKTPEGEQGPSFWFDVPNQSFIQLSTRFY